MHPACCFLHLSCQDIDRSQWFGLNSIGGLGGNSLNIEIQQVAEDVTEEIIVRCHDPEAPWIKNIREAASALRSVCGYKDGSLHRLKLTDIYYFEVVDNVSFLYTCKNVFEAHEKLYEFEAITSGTSLFRCSKSMILNAEKIDYIRPSLSGRFEAVLSNGEKVIVSRKYVANLKLLLGI